MGKVILQHTVDVHFEGVQSAIRQYQIPADARMYLLKQLVDYPKLASMDLELKKDNDDSSVQ